MGTKKAPTKTYTRLSQSAFSSVSYYLFLDVTYWVAPQPEQVYPIITVSSHAVCVTTVS